MPRSPSAWACFWYAIGATTIGCGRSLPSTGTEGSHSLTSTSIRGNRASRDHEASLSRSVISSPAPPAK